MASLSGQNPSQTFPSLIKTVDNNPISASLVQLSDGNGIGFPMKISTTMVQITGSLSGTATLATSASHATIAESLQGGLSTTIGTWILTPGANNVSFSVDGGYTYQMWVRSNIPNGIISWIASVVTSNTNVPVIGSQYGWYYAPGNALVLNSMPDQIAGTSGSIITSPGSYVPNTSNTFNFSITNNSETSQSVYWGYIKM